MTEGHSRSFGYWSKAKLQILHRYLPAFLTASSKVPERIYIDAFAGSGHGVDRLTGEEFDGSARIALEAAGGQHRFTRLVYFEKEARAANLETTLHADYPGRDIRIYPGDCNTQIPIALATLSGVRWAPTFAFIDPDGLEFAWSTLEALADHKRGYRGHGAAKRENKVELWLLFSSQGLARTLAHDKSKLRISDKERATRLFGTDRWSVIHDLRIRGDLDAPEARAEYVNLMRWRLIHDLGYVWAHSLELKNLQGGIVYHMIFATDNEAGNRIMSDLYARAAREIPKMRQEAIDRKRRQLAFELPADPGTLAPPYDYEPPWEPPGSTPPEAE